MKSNLIDIHNHMLFGVDDGSDSIDISLEMAMLSIESGVTDVICTPHSIPGLYNNYAEQQLFNRFNKLKAAIAEEKLPLNIHLGMEVMGNANTVSDLHNNKLQTLAGSDYMLIEFQFDEEISNANYILEAIAEYGYKPIIAHPERYHFVAKSPSVLYYWADNHYLMQCNKDSIKGKFGRMVNQICMDILKDGLCSFIASDSHGALSRTPYLEYEYNTICNIFGVNYAKSLFFENPRRIILNQSVQIN